MAPTVSHLFVYPVKGLGGISLANSPATSRGLAHDRRFMVVDAEGHFLSQREIPRMATIWTEIDAGRLRLSAADAGEVELPLEPAAGEPLRATVWNSTCRAIAPSSEADAWLQAVLGVDCRLAYMPDSTVRESDGRFAGPGKRVGFADGYAYLVVSEASLADLNGRIAAPVTLARFRPNIVVSGTEPYAEDGWGSIAIGSATLRLVKPCGRCSVVTVDPGSGDVSGPEPLATLSGYRGSSQFGPRFGMNAVTDREGLISVGDAVLPL